MPDHFDIARVSHGAVIEAINAGLDACWENILDPNTEATVKREVTVKIVLKPDASREEVETAVQVTRKTAPDKAITSRAMLGQANGRIVAQEYVKPTLQTDLDDHIAARAGDGEAITRIGGGKKEL